MRLAQAVGRLVLAGRELTRLAGYTQRVVQLREVMLDLDHGKYQRTMIETKEGEAPLIPGSGRIITQDRIIKFEGVPLVTPNGDCIVRSLDFEVISLCFVLYIVSHIPLSHLGNLGNECISVWTEWLWEKLTFQDSRRVMALVRRSAD